MAHPTVIWTQALHDAATRLASASYAYATTIPERGAEMRDHARIGAPLSGMALDCVAMLRSRMHERTPEENAFNAAWAAAWAAAKDREAPHDPALDR
jgi:hypothetical protein